MLNLPLRYRQNWSIAFARMPKQDRVALNVFAQLARSARAIFDVGMNAGSYLYTAIGHRQPAVPIIGFEPDEELCAAVRSNVERNRLQDVTIETCAVSAASGIAQLHRSFSDQMHSLEPSFLQRVGSPTVGKEKVRTITIDDIAAERGLDPDLIKIDVEGHEAGVIRGAPNVLDRVRPALLVEMGRGSANGTLFEELLDRGYKASLLAETAIPVPSLATFLSLRGQSFENYLFLYDNGD